MITLELKKYYSINLELEKDSSRNEIYRRLFEILNKLLNYKHRIPIFKVIPSFALEYGKLIIQCLHIS